MPFPQIAKNNLVVTLSLANLFTDHNGRYLPLAAQIEETHELQKYIGWQAHNLYHRPSPGRNPAKQGLTNYLMLESTVALFMRYMNIPECQIQSNLAYLSDNVQKLIYQHFKEEILRPALLEPTRPALTIVDKGVRSLVKEKVQGYSERLAEQTREEWQLFVAEIDVGIDVLSKQYKTILTNLHAQFYDFRKGCLAFIQNYYDRYMFLARVEQWLTRAPLARFYQPVDKAKLSAFCQKLQELEARQNELDINALFAAFAELQRTSLTQEQYKAVAEALIQLRPKYDAYRLGQDSLTPEAQLKEFMSAWPKPQLPRLVTPACRREVDESWKQLRAKHQETKEKEALSESSSLKHKKPGSAAAAAM